MKAPDGVFCLCEKLYHVLLSVGHLFKREFQSIIEQRCFPQLSVAIDGAGRA